MNNGLDCPDWQILLEIETKTGLGIVMRIVTLNTNKVV